MTVVNKKGMVLDICESYQLVPGDSEDLCGPWAVSSLRLTGLPNKGTRGDAYAIQNWCFKEVDKYMPQGHIKWPGSEKTDMYNFIQDSLDPISKQRNLHYQEVLPTRDNIRAAVLAGYPVLITVNERSLQEKKTNVSPPYPWNLNVNHIIPVMGIDKDGDFICADELNNRFQGYWPVVYKSNFVASWACVIQVIGPDNKHPWLAPIPDTVPLGWKKGEAQLFMSTPENPHRTQQNIDTWNATQHLLTTSIDVNTDIVAKKWLQFMMKYNLGSPIARFPSVDWNGKSIEVTQFLYGQCQNLNGNLRFWHLDKEITL
jgi:hypothetical protein